MQVRESMTHSAAKRILPFTQAYLYIYIMKFPPDLVHTYREDDLIGVSFLHKARLIIKWRRMEKKACYLWVNIFSTCALCVFARLRVLDLFYFSHIISKSAMPTNITKCQRSLRQNVCHCGMWISYKISEKKTEGNKEVWMW